MVRIIRSAPSQKRRKFQGVMAGIGLLAAVWAFVGAPTPWSIFRDASTTDFPKSNTEIVLDASAAMGRPFEGNTKLAAAAAAITKHVRLFSYEGFALRRSGGRCDDVGPLLIDFGANHGDDVSTEALKQRPGGSSNLANTIIAAIDDFSNPARFNDPQAENLVLIVTGTGTDDCVENAAMEVAAELKHSDVDAAIKLVPFGIADEDVAHVCKLEAVLNGSTGHEPSTPSSADGGNSPRDEENANCTASERPPASEEESPGGNHKDGAGPGGATPEPTAPKHLTAVQFPDTQRELDAAITRATRP